MTIEIEGVDKTSLVTFPSVNKVDNLNAQVDNFTFEIKNYGGVTYKPNLNDEVIVMNGANKVFGGVIIKIEEKIKSNNIISYNVICNDYSQNFKQYLITQRFTATTLFTILENLITNYAPGFTFDNIAGDVDIESFSFNRLNLSDALQKLADALSYVWYVDYDKDLHFFPRNTESAPFNLSDSSNNFIVDSLQIAEDITQIRNSILVQGGSAVSEAARTEHVTTDGVNDKFNLVNKYSEAPTITLAGSPMLVGVDNVDEDDDFDVMWNYNEKTIRFTSFPSTDQDVAITGLYEFPVLVLVQNALSIAEFGKYEYAITDKTILSQDQAIERAKAELASYQAELYEGSFKTNTDGLRSGQIININLTKRDRNIDVLIQSVTTTMKDPDGEVFEYNVKFATLKSIGIIEYLQRQLRKEEIVDDSAETLLNYADLGSDSFSVSDSMDTPTKSSPPYKWTDSAGLTPNKMVWGYFTWS